MIILLHSSKTMRIVPRGNVQLHQPQLLEKTKKLDAYLKTLSSSELGKIMKLSPSLAEKTHDLIAAWTAKPEQQSPALDSFIGDIYSGLQADKLDSADRDYADQTLRIFSGLYGIIRPYDGIYPYRLEMGYKFPEPKFASLYDYWGQDIADTLPKEGPIVNLASEEFAETITSFIDASRIVAPKFLTVSPKNGEPAFVVVHAKIARGAFAHWLIKNRIENLQKLSEFKDLGYTFDKNLSTKDIPTFVCKEFGGKGLSMKKLHN